MKRLIKKLSTVRWEVGFVKNGLDGVFSNSPQYVWIKNQYNDRWFADPFILDVDDKYIYLLVEEMRYKTHKGRIAMLTIDKNTMVITNMQIVLEEPTHLSFPAIIRQDGHIYVYPENAGSGKLKLYELVNGCLIFRKELFDGMLADAVITDRLGTRKMFATLFPKYNDNELQIFTRNSEGQIVVENKVLFDDNHARMAGDFFEFKGNLYRPAQNCNRNYGGGVIIERVIFQNDNFQFQFEKEINNRHSCLQLGMHTLNVYRDYVVVDRHMYNSFLGLVVAKLVQIKKYIYKEK